MKINFNSKLIFGAHVNLDRTKISDVLSKDKTLNNNDRQKLETLMDNVDSFSKMKENSVVTIRPFNYKNMSTLVCYVTDKETPASRMIDERMSKKLARDDKYSTRYLSNIKSAITDIDKESAGLKDITDTIKNLQNISGIYNEYRGPIKKNKDEIASYFCKNILYNGYDDYFKKGKNPTRRIIDTLNNIDKHYENFDNYISISSDSRKNNFKIISVDKQSNQQHYHEISLRYLMEDPLNRLFNK